MTMVVLEYMDVDKFITKDVCTEEVEDITEVSNNVENSTVKTVPNQVVNCPSGKGFNLFLS